MYHIVRSSLKALFNLIIVHLSFCLTVKLFLYRVRIFVHGIVTIPCFDTFIMIIIILSSITLAAEDPVQESSQRNHVLTYFDYVFTGIFALEMFLKVSQRNLIEVLDWCKLFKAYSLKNSYAEYRSLPNDWIYKIYNSDVLWDVSINFYGGIFFYTRTSFWK